MRISPYFFAGGGGGAGGTLTDGDKGDITVSAAGATWTIDNGVVTFAKMQAITDGRLLGASGGTVVEEITVGTGLSLAANVLSSTITQYTDEQAQDAIGAMLDASLTYVDATPLLQRAALTGDITAPAGSNATTLATVNANVGSFGSTTQVAVFTVNAKGLLTAASNATIAITSGAVTDFNEAAQDAVGTILVDSSEIDFTYSDATPSITAALIDNSVSLARLVNASAQFNLIGRSTAAAGPWEQKATSADVFTMLGSADNAAIRSNIVAAGTGVSNTFTAAQEINVDTATGATLRRVNAGALGPYFRTIHDSSTPAASDVLGGLAVWGRDSTAVETQYVTYSGVLLDTTNGSEDAAAAIGAITAGTEIEVARFDGASGFSMFGANPVVDQNRLLVMRQYTTGTLPASPADGKWAFDTTTTQPKYSFGGAWVALPSGGGVSDGDKGDITVSASGATWTIDADVVTYAKMQNVSATHRLVGRNTAGAGDPEEVTILQAIDWIGGTRGQVLFRGVGDWQALAPGTSGQMLTSGGAGADVSWTTPGALTDGDKGDITVSASGATWTIDADVVTFAKMQNIATATFIGRNTAATGDPEELSVATAKTMLNLAGSNTGDQTITLTSDVTGSGTGSFATTIANNAVTYAKMQDVTATNRLLGRFTAAAGDVEEITLAADHSFSGGALQLEAFTGDVAKAAGSTSTTIPNDVITYAKMQNIATDSLIGRDTAATGDPETIGVGGGIEFTGTGAIQTSAFTGDATKTAGGTALTLATVNANVGSFGSATQVGTFTVNAKGLLTAASNATIAVTSTAVTDFNEAAQDAVGTILVDTAEVNFTYSDATPSITASLIDNSVALARLVNASAQYNLIGRSTAAAGPWEQKATSADVFTMLGSADNAAIRSNIVAAGTGVTNTFLAAQVVTDAVTVQADGPASLTVSRYSSNPTPPANNLNKARGTQASSTDVVTSDELGRYRFRGWGGGAFREAAAIAGRVTAATPSATDMQSQLDFECAPAASVTPSVVLRLDHATGLSMFGANPVVDNNRLLVMRQYTTATLPAAPADGKWAFDSDTNQPKYSNGGAWNALPGGGTSLAFQEEGGAVLSSATANFVGSGVTVTDVAGTATITISGGTFDYGTSIALNASAFIN